MTELLAVRSRETRQFSWSYFREVGNIWGRKAAHQRVGRPTLPEVLPTNRSHGPLWHSVVFPGRRNHRRDIVHSASRESTLQNDVHTDDMRIRRSAFVCSGILRDGTKSQPWMVCDRLIAAAVEMLVSTAVNEPEIRSHRPRNDPIWEDRPVRRSAANRAAEPIFRRNAADS